VFWALRGGGAGSWGVIISVTFKTYPTFNATLSNFGVEFFNTTDAELTSILASHAAHIQDLDSFRASQYGYIIPGLTNGTYNFTISTWFPNTTAEQSKEAMRPLIDEIKDSGLSMNVTTETYDEGLFNDLAYQTDDAYFPGVAFMGSRLIPESAYSQPQEIAEMYAELLHTQTAGQVDPCNGLSTLTNNNFSIVLMLVAGGKSSRM
jgi:hypothetical protein